MGCGASIDSIASQATPVLLPRTSQNLQLGSIREKRFLDDLPDFASDLHIGMSDAIKQAPMRFLKIVEVLTWAHLYPYEKVPGSACLDMPYTDASDSHWNQTAVISWRWGASKPANQQSNFSAMMPAQFTIFRELLARGREQGLEYVWIDWCCSPQYGGNNMLEVMRSKLFYARARAMLIVPALHPLPANGAVAVLLARTARALKKKAATCPFASMAANSVNAILSWKMIASREYFSRVWTLTERIARYGRDEKLQNWLSLEVWVGMVVDAMLHTTVDKAASLLFKKVLGTEATALLEQVLEPIASAAKAGSVLVAEGLEEKVAELLETATRVWQESSIADEAPTKAWLLSYLNDAHTDMLRASYECDRVWAVYSYFCWRQVDHLSSSKQQGPPSSAVLLEALKDLVLAASGKRYHTVRLAVKMGIGSLIPTDPIDQQLLQACTDGNATRVQELLQAGASVLLAQTEKDGPNALHVVAEKGNIEVARVLLQSGIDIDTPKKSGMTALIIAAQRGHADLVRLLLEAGADKEAAFPDGATAVYVAAEKGQVDSLNILMEAGANLGVRLNTGFMYNTFLIAVLNGHLEAVKVLLDAGMDKNAACSDGASGLYLAAEKNNLAILKLLLEAGVDKGACLKSGATALYIASSSGFLDIVKELITAGANVNAARKDKSTPIYVASEKGHVQVVQALLDAGAEVDSAFQSGATPIYIAAQNNRPDVIRVLIRAHANRNVVLKGGYQPIHSAALAGHVDALRALIEGGVDKDTRLDDGATPLYLAAEKGHLEAVRYLLEVGANKALTDEGGRAPADIAKEGSGVKALLV